MNPDDQLDLHGIADQRIANLVLGMPRHGYCAGLDITIPDPPTRVLVEHLVETLWFYVNGTSKKLRVPMDQHLSDVLRDIEMIRVKLRASHHPERMTP